MKELIKRLKERGYVIDYDPGGHLNVARRDGFNCEFYPAGGEDEYLCATYTIDNDVTNIDEYLDEDGIYYMLYYISKILGA